MTNEQWAGICTVLVIMTIILTALITFKETRDCILQEAVIHKVAEWVADKDGRPQFQWIERDK